jgi:hypothetical protein
MSKRSLDDDAMRNRLFTGELGDMALKELAQRHRLGIEVSALLFGRDIGQLAARATQTGARVVVGATTTDLRHHPKVRALPLALNTPPDPAAVPEAPFDIVVGQLALHSLPYKEAQKSLRELLHLLKIGGKLYLSAYGLHSTLGDHYPDSGKLVKDRFAELPAPIAEHYDLHGQVCLYSERNLITLLFEIGASVLSSATGALGNVRAIAVRI